MEGFSSLPNISGARKKSGQYKEHHGEHHGKHNEKHHWEHHKDSQKSRFQEALDQPQEQPNADSEEEPDPAFLGALDYHNFLHGSSRLKARVAQSPTGASSSSAPPVTPLSQLNRDIVESQFTIPKTAIKIESSTVRETSLPTLFNNPSQFLSEKESAETIKPVSSLWERCTQAQTDQVDKPEALRKIPTSDLSILSEIPATLTSSVRTPSSSPSTLPPTPGTLRSARTLASIPSGPLSTISYKEIDPVKLQPFIGPLTKQQPPPDRPLPQIPFPSPIKRRTHRSRSSSNMAGDRKHSRRETGEKNAKQEVEETAELHASDKRGRGLRKKISKFFIGDQSSKTADAAVATSFRPLSIDTSRDSKSFSDIFDDVYKAAGGPSTSARASGISGRGSKQTSRQTSRQSESGIVSAASGEYQTRPFSQLLDSTPIPVQTAPTSLSTALSVDPPPLIEHPAIRGDKTLQAQLGLIDTKSVLTPGSSLQSPPQDAHTLSVTCRGPTPTDTGARKAASSISSALSATMKSASVNEKPQAVVTAQNPEPEDVDPLPAFDRTVDLTLHRKSTTEGQCVITSIPRPSNKFQHVLTLFIEEYANGRPFTRYNRKKRFRYFDLPNKARFEIVRHIIADTHTGKPILLNGRRQACPAWPVDAFVTLWSVLGPLQPYLWACPRLRADIMVTLLLTRSFHIIFNPFVKPASSPLATKWLTRYLHMMQDVRLEIDMTKLGFGPSWESTAMSTKLQDIGNLVWMFTEKMLTRDEEANSLGRLTVHCRRYFGYRQGKNPLEEREDAYQYPLIGSDQNDPGSLNICEDGSAYNQDKPWNYNRLAPRLPPSARNPYSGHRRHHADRPNRVPYVNENQFSVADSLRKLVGRVDTIRMVGFSESWTYWTHEALWPKEEQAAIQEEDLSNHIDRCTPSRHDYVAPGHAVYFDFGIGSGVHRYPALPDSEPMVCVHYDVENDLYVELSSGKVLTITEDGAEVIARVRGPNIPVLARVPSPEPFGPPMPRGSPVFLAKPSLIPGPKDRRNVSPTMLAMRKGTPTKAARLLGLPGTKVTNTQMSDPVDETDEEDRFATPTKSRTVSNTSAQTGGVPEQSEDSMHELTPRHSRSSTSTGTGVPLTGRLSSKRSFLVLGGPRKKNN